MGGAASCTSLILLWVCIHLVHFLGIGLFCLVSSGKRELPLMPECKLAHWTMPNGKTTGYRDILKSSKSRPGYHPGPKVAGNAKQAVTKKEAITNIWIEPGGTISFEQLGGPPCHWGRYMSAPSTTPPLFKTSMNAKAKPQAPDLIRLRHLGCLNNRGGIASQSWRIGVVSQID